MGKFVTVTLHGGPADGQKMKLPKGPEGQYPKGCYIRVKGRQHIAQYERGDDMVWRHVGYVEPNLKEIPPEQFKTAMAAKKAAEGMGLQTQLDLDNIPVDPEKMERLSFVWLDAGMETTPDLNWVLWAQLKKTGDWHRMGWYSSLPLQPKTLPKPAPPGWHQEWKPLDWEPPVKKLKGVMAEGAMGQMVHQLEASRAKHATVPMLEEATGEITWMTPGEFRMAYRMPDGTLSIPAGFRRLTEEEARRHGGQQ